MPLNPPAGIQRLTVRIGYEDQLAAIEFLSRAFGFPERRHMRLERPDGSIIITEVQVGDAYLMIAPAGAHAIASPKTLGSATESLMVYVDHIDQHFSNAKAQGATIVVEPSDQYWGDRRYEARDPEGHTWFFHQRTRDVPQSEIDEIERSFSTNT